MPVASGSTVSFNGGTITGPVKIDMGTDAVQLTIEPIDGANENTVEIQTADGPAIASIYVEDDDATIHVDGGSGTGGASLQATADGGTVLATGPTHSVSLDGATASSKISAGTGATPSEFVVNPLGYLLIATNVAPADNALVANQMAIWFDPTNGAAKLMIKAKQADGTVKTGSVNVTT